MTVGVAIFILDKAFSFQSGTLAAPQANLMAAVIKSMMSREPVTLMLSGIGKNKSKFHFDALVDKVTITAKGKTIAKNGKFLI